MIKTKRKSKEKEKRKQGKVKKFLKSIKLCNTKKSIIKKFQAKEANFLLRINKKKKKN